MRDLPTADTLVLLAVKPGATPEGQAAGPEHPEAVSLARVGPGLAGVWLGQAWLRRALEADKAWVRMGAWELRCGINAKTDLELCSLGWMIHLLCALRVLTGGPRMLGHIPPPFLKLGHFSLRSWSASLHPCSIHLHSSQPPSLPPLPSTTPSLTGEATSVAKL